jgi:L-rhamnose isomerase
MKKEGAILNNYRYAQEAFAEYGVDCRKAIDKFSQIKMSVHCWQGDDVKGLENVGEVASQNVVTGNYMGAARTGDELRADIDAAVGLSPFKHKVNLHSCYSEGNSPRNRQQFKDFSRWVEWAKEKGYGIDFNATFFTHEMMDGNLSLTSLKKEVRNYWIEAGQNGREIAYRIGKELNQTCVNNIWIPDGMKDIPADRFCFRNLLIESLDKILEKKYDKKYLVDALEGKLFSIGAESFTAGSYDFYLAYAVRKNVGLCLDTGHFHLTESVADKLSAISPFLDDILLHISRGVRWDSDHVVVQTDELLALFEEITRGDLFNKVHLGLDYFDASINRVAAWAIGLRAAAKAALTALLQPFNKLKEAEMSGDYTKRLFITDEMKNLPYNAVWEYLLLTKDIPAGEEAIGKIKEYEKDVLSKRV